MPAETVTEILSILLVGLWCGNRYDDGGRYQGEWSDSPQLKNENGRWKGDGEAGLGSLRCVRLLMARPMVPISSMACCFFGELSHDLIQ